MKERYLVFQRKNGIFFLEDRLRKKQNSLKTRDKKRPVGFATRRMRRFDSQPSTCKSPGCTAKKLRRRCLKD